MPHAAPGMWLRAAKSLTMRSTSGKAPASLVRRAESVKVGGGALNGGCADSGRFRIVAVEASRTNRAIDGFISELVTRRRLIGADATGRDRRHRVVFAFH